MTTSPEPREPRREHPSTYFVADRSNQEELKRLQIQDRLLTASMGGVLPEQPSPASLQRVLDVGCGTGDWLIEAAKTYPTLQLLVGVDVSRTFVTYARERARAEGVSGRVEFHVMDALRMLEFPNSFFHLVNHRAASSWLRTWDWPKLLQEYWRVVQPEGVVRVTEPDWFIKSSSPAHARLSQLWQRAFYQAGYFFHAASDGVTSQLARLLQQHGLLNVESKTYTLEYRAGTPEGQHFCEDLRLGYRTIQPFLRKWISVPEDYEDLYQQMLREIQQPDFVATVRLVTAWGTKL